MCAAPGGWREVSVGGGGLAVGAGCVPSASEGGGQSFERGSGGLRGWVALSFSRLAGPWGRQRGARAEAASGERCALSGEALSAAAVQLCIVKAASFSSGEKIVSCSQSRTAKQLVVCFLFSLLFFSPSQE